MRAKFIVYTSRYFDNKRGFENNVTRKVVEELISKGCSYCGEVNYGMMTIDRLDNSTGHVISNVVPACYRCNMIRGNMPYEAWMNVAPAVRDTFKKGLFGDWAGPNSPSSGMDPSSQTTSTSKTIDYGDNTACEISVADPGAVPGASTNLPPAWPVIHGGELGSTRVVKARSVARYDTTVIGS